MWSDDWFYDLDPSEKLMWVFLLTNDRQNVAGVFKANERWIGANTGFERQVVEMILSRFEQVDKIRRVDDWIIITNHYKHQSLSPKIESGIKRIVSELPKNVLERYPMDMVCIRYRTLLNLTLLNLSEGETSSPELKTNKKDMIWNRQSDEYEDGVVDFDGDGEIKDQEKEAKQEDRLLREKIKHNLRLVEESRGLSYTPAALNADVKIYQQLLKYGWSHEGIIKEYIETINDPYWKNERELGKFPSIKTVEFRVRNKKPV